jgi:PTH2 family peptidyl-tRNA hydrolase
MNTKQVIVIRKDLNMRKGKMVAQGAHASMAVLTKYMTKNDRGWWAFYPPKEMEAWLLSSFTKICVYVNSEQELLEIYNKATQIGLPCSVIRDNGKTEFKEPTYTAVAVGPADSSMIDEITGELPLL